MAPLLKMGQDGENQKVDSLWTAENRNAQKYDLRTTRRLVLELDLLGDGHTSDSVQGRVKGFFSWGRAKGKGQRTTFGL